MGAHLNVERLQSWLGGELDHSQTRVVEEHLEECDECAQLLSSIENDGDQFTSYLRQIMDGDASGDAIPTTAPSVIKGESAGTKIGPYKLLQLLGEGGMGTVWMAQQAQPVQRTVALKIIKAGMDTKEVIGRFEAERQALAMMEHPNIAKVLDAGATETGRPYFVMELVRGIPITKYCDQNRLSTTDRLNIFCDVCNAIQHAHRKGIIHRDIKPTNVLITLDGNRPIIKVIDFGLAKATNIRLTEKTFFTALGQMVGTPAYMSPEQTEMTGLDVDTRSDVFRLASCYTNC